MPFDAETVALEMVGALRRTVEVVEKRDRDLASQMRRAATGVVLNLAEARKRQGGDRTHLFRCASGSAAETRTALRVAVAWGYVDEQPAAEALLDRLLAITWRLSHPR